MKKACLWKLNINLFTSYKRRGSNNSYDCLSCLV